MQTIAGISLADVQAVYDGAEGDLWELVMGEQIHIGGFGSSMDLAERAASARAARADLAVAMAPGCAFSCVSATSLT